MVNRRRSDVAFIVPVFNEGTVIKGVIEQVLDEYAYVVCVNDGSTDHSASKISATNAILINHPINMGQGAALQTGIEFARLLPVKYLVTYDADGQHRLEDVKTMLEVIEKGSHDIVLGSRFLGNVIGMKASKRLILKLAIKFSNLVSGVNLTDTHNGLRVFNRKVAESIQITMPDMTHASEIIDIIVKQKYRYTEVPVTIKYSEYSVSKGQTMINAINIAFDMMLKRVSK